MPSLLFRLMQGQVLACRRIERLVPSHLTQDGHEAYLTRLVPAYLTPGLRIVDVGGGKRPYLSPEAKAELGADVTGLDIDGSELERAPAGSYDRTVATDIAVYTGHGDADLIFCQAVLEHVAEPAAEPRFRRIEALHHLSGVLDEIGDRAPTSSSEHSAR